MTREAPSPPNHDPAYTQPHKISSPINAKLQLKIHLNEYIHNDRSINFYKKLSKNILNFFCLKKFQY